MTAPSFDTVQTGTSLPAVSQAFAQEDIDRYALASLDMNPVHTNAEWAARAQVFGLPETVGHGMMTMSTMASAVTRAWGITGVRFVEAKFTKPVKVGETVTATARIKRKHHVGPGRNWVQIDIEARDTTGDVVGVADVGFNLPD